MNESIKIDLDAIELLARKATPGPWWIDSHGHMMVSQANGGHEPIFQAANLVENAARHPETGNLSHWPNDWDASFIASANPAVVLELVRRLRAAETLAAARIEHVPKQARTVLVFADIDPDHRAEAEEFSEAIKKRCTSCDSTLVAFFPAGADVKACDSEQLRQVGLLRLPSTHSPKGKLRSTLNDGRAPAAIARERGWGTGTRIVGDEGSGPTVIEITAIGEGDLLAKKISHNGKRVKANCEDESSWTLDCRDWQEVPS
uniref:DUF7241 domain-containing protein n=1 Tax=Pseudomonas phage Touem01 TaxID=3138548 RepID=A0AAU6W1J0_9VIRU